MDDEVFCVFVITVCLVTLAMPAAAQSVFALFATAIVIATLVCRNNDHGVERPDRSNHEVPGRG
jgi:hypothetical protein